MNNQAVNVIRARYDAAPTAFCHADAAALKQCDEDIKALLAHIDAANAVMERALRIVTATTPVIKAATQVTETLATWGDCHPEGSEQLRKALYAAQAMLGWSALDAALAAEQQIVAQVPDLLAQRDETRRTAIRTWLTNTLRDAEKLAASEDVKYAGMPRGDRAGDFQRGIAHAAECGLRLLDDLP